MLSGKRTDRIPLWDNLRLILIFLVVLGHIVDRYSGSSETAKGIIFYIYSFHMPAFIFVSGMFCKKTVETRNYNALFSYLVLFLVIKILVGAGDLIDGGKFRFTIISESSVPWYAFALFLFCLVTMFLCRYKPLYVFILSIIFGCFVGFDSSLGDILVLARTAVFYPFFYAGYCIKGEKLASVVKKTPVIIVAAALLVAFGVGVYFGIEKLYDFRSLLTGRNPFSALDEYADYGLLLRLAYYPLAFLLIMCVVAITPTKRIPLLTACGGRTVQVYAMHILVIEVFYHLINVDAVMEKICPVNPVLMVIPLSVIVTAICSLKIFEKPFALVLHPPLKKE